MNFIKKTLLLIFILNFWEISAQESDSTKAQIVRQVKAMRLMAQPIFKLEGQELPSFKLHSLDGHEVTSESLKGKPTVINFWYTNCRPCREEIPVLNEVQSHFKDSIHFVAITFQNQDKVNTFLEKHEFNFSHLIDAKAYLDSFGRMGYPKTIILDEEMTILEIKGSISKNPMTNELLIEEFKNELIATLTELNKS